MLVEYREKNNCYVTDLRLNINGRTNTVKTVIDTGATNTTLSLDIIIDENDDDIIQKFANKLDYCALETGIKRVDIHGATKEPNITETYAYDACFENVIVGGHFMKKFHTRIMINGAKGICVIGNDFLNMCNYYHKAGEYWLTVENPIEQKYYESFNKKKIFCHHQLDLLLSEIDNNINL